MTINDDLIDRLAGETDTRMAEEGSVARAMTRRRRALAARMNCVVTLTEDGMETRVEGFEAPPTLAELVERAGPKAYVLAVAVRKAAFRDPNRDEVYAAE